MVKRKKKDPAAVALGKKRWANTSQRERSEHGTMAVTARWKKWKKGKERRWPTT